MADGKAPDRAPSSADEAALLQAVALSRRHMEAGAGGPFGAVIAHANGTIVAEGWNRVTSANDPTAHAEVTAIRRACEALGTFDLAGHVIYTSCEPCPMCLGAIYWARLDRMVYANTRADARRIGFDDAFIYDQIGLDPARRSLAAIHLPLDEASAVFDDWARKTDKVTY